MNKVLNFVLLFFVGWVLSFLSGNIIVTSAGCFILGLVLNRKANPTTRSAKSSTPIETGSGARTGSAATGERPPRTYYPSYIRYMLDEILLEDESKYLWLIQDLVMLDEEGHYWCAGAEDSKWYRYQEGNWVPDEPVGTLQTFRRSDSFLEGYVGSVEESGAQTLTAPAATKYCINCGASIPETAKHCPKCGAAQ